MNVIMNSKAKMIYKKLCHVQHLVPWRLVQVLV